MSNIYLTSDYHFCHDKEFIWRKRGYSNVWEMNESLVQKTNSVVTEDDDLYILGDLMLGTGGEKYIERLSGRLHIVLGNHDTDNRAAFYSSLPNVVEIAEVGLKLKHGKYHCVLTHYPCITNTILKPKLSQSTLNFFGHTHQTSCFTEDDNPFLYHVGLDSNNCTPILINDALAAMRQKLEDKNHAL